jgi:two-component system, cell cycle sensor histidine kinase PleC
MALEALRPIYPDTRPNAGRALVLFSKPAAVQMPPALTNVSLRMTLLHYQLLPVALGLTALAGIGLNDLGCIALGRSASLCCFAALALALIIPFASARHAAFRLRHDASAGLVPDAMQAAGAAAVRWNLVDGGLTWAGNIAALFEDCQTPSNFRDLKPHLHPEDSLYSSISDALRDSARDVCWSLRLSDGELGWKTFHLRGEIAAGEGSEAPVFTGVLIRAAANVPQLPVSQGHLARLAPIVEALPMSFAVWDTQKRLQFCNRKFRQLYRLSPGAALPGAPFEEVQAKSKERIAQCPAGIGTAPGRFQLREQQLPDGTWLQIYEYWTGDGTMVSVGTDITLPKLSERRILDRERELRATVESYEQSRRQLEIQTRQLRELAEGYNEEKIRAEAANRAKSEFLANVSHELRTPLNAVIGFSEMMRDGVLGPIGNKKYQSYANDINSSGRYLLEMIDDILDMSKIEAGRVVLSPEWIELGPLFNECLRVVHPAALERRVKLLEAGNTGVPVFADKRALKQILINLLANAVKFTLPGGKVLLRAYRYRGSVRIAISDTGVGIARHDLGRLGRPFEQVQNQFTKGHKGTGLGLAISRSLAELHGGKLDIKSKAGEGTIVTCILPAHEEKTQAREAA